MATLRAAHHVAKRLGWRTMKGGENGDGLTFYDPTSLRSYAEARRSAHRRCDLRSGRGHGRERFEREFATLDDPKGEWARFIEPGGPWWSMSI